MDESLNALGAACVYSDFRDDLFADAEGLCDSANFSLNSAQVAALRAVTGEFDPNLALELKAKMEEVENLVRLMSRCPDPPCPWPPTFRETTRPAKVGSQ